MAEAILATTGQDVAIPDHSVMPKPSADGGRNVIFYGAPGTGKSHKVDSLTKGQSVIRTVFHPDTQNSDFFGSLKPSMSGGEVTYGFQPGPLARAIADAATDGGRNHFLVIEELNRAPAAAVFGELFQLLDRHEDGTGIYKVDFPTPESAAWFRARGFEHDKLVMPRNLSIYATMNSADQGVYPLDTAFRRRWEQIYLPVYGTGSGYPGATVRYVSKQGQCEIDWMRFVKSLNEFLQEKFDFPEDRLVGPWFARTKEMEDGQIPPKVLLYLVDDLLRHEDRTKLFGAGLKTYGAIARAIENGGMVFSNEFLSRLDIISTPTVTVGEAEDTITAS